MGTGDSTGAEIVGAKTHIVEEGGVTPDSCSGNKSDIFHCNNENN